ncbi:hypothetical protein ABZ891_31075 [Streptomyces sp. NPDC047023]|uniref:hypothetical protein n=1 Tax=Streptomyces sp. NPDC047023 TaxID=3155139 RepID=UPI0033C2AC07
MTSGYPPLPEPFSEALGEAAHTAAMAYRLVLPSPTRSARQLVGLQQASVDLAAFLPRWGG